MSFIWRLLAFWIGLSFRAFTWFLKPVLIWWNRAEFYFAARALGINHRNALLMIKIAEGLKHASMVAQHALVAGAVAEANKLSSNEELLFRYNHGKPMPTA